ncbi:MULTISPECIES: ATP--guanido phosphotransferase [Caproicibacterium]|uniref:ATP--guanido phosphotransferase n=1 Tax=Caproicibacterium argilliputei TaxID=3030016 RepID=A0AA97H4F3_9FIRM|nr:ATP--guanido phosphotransferase [Caproicibacterium argilliputei]WOC33393.1 ATP--guanido phosphotransferase [Caproicibacterium argilliputei]
MSHKWYESTGPDSDVVLGSCVCMMRNLADLPFPARMSRSDKERSRLRVEKALCGVPNAAGAFLCADLEDLGETARVSFVERQLCTPEFIAKPAGRTLFYTADEHVSIMVNGADHVRLQLVLPGCQPGSALSAADTLDTMLDRVLRYAFHGDIGYLTQSLTDLGTGMVPALLLHLPALQQGGAVERLSSDVAQLGFSLRGVFDGAVETAGAVFELANRITLGISEKNAVENLQSIGSQLIERERRARTELLATVEAQDAVSRGLAVMVGARMLEFGEFLHLYANVRMGLCAGLVHGLRPEQMDTLLFAVQPATMVLRAGKALDPQQRQTRRAQLVSGALSAAQRL